MTLRPLSIFPIALFYASLFGCSSSTKVDVQKNGCWYVHDGSPSSIGMLCKCDNSDQDFLLKGDGAVINAQSSFDIYEDHIDLVRKGKVVERVGLIEDNGFLVANHDGNKITIQRLDATCEEVNSPYPPETKLIWTNAVLATDSIRKLRFQG